MAHASGNSGSVGGALACAIALLVGSAPAQIEREPDATEERVIVRSQAEIAELDRLIADGAHAEAQQRVERLLEQSPKDFRLHYSAARLASALNQPERVLDRLLGAVRYGFVDYHRIDHDPLFASFRQHADYRRFVAAWATFLDERGALDDASARARFADGYRAIRHESLRLNIVAAVDQETLDDAMADLERIARFIDAEVFPVSPADPRRPHPWVTVLVCTQADFYRMVPMLGVGGIYEPEQKHLICRDIGPSLRHEFVHALHWRHMESIGQVHPLWFQEGLATLLEDLAPAPDSDRSVVQSSWRTNIARRLARSASTTPWPRLFSMSSEHFITRNPRANYAQVRAITDYLHTEGRLGAYYRALQQTWADDPTGLKAMEVAFDQPAADVERAFRVWTRGLAEVADISWPGQATLPFRIKPGPLDGMRVDQPVPSAMVKPVSSKAKEHTHLRRGDVIVAINGAPIPTTDDLVRAMGPLQPGQTATLLIRRDESRFEVRVPLVRRDEFEHAW
jgi:hypothetical protein